jgi:hypothetical protein
LTEDRAFGADDVARSLYVGERLRKLRFQMTDNSWSTETPDLMIALFECARRTEGLLSARDECPDRVVALL